MPSISQLDGTCSANCCNADGASDEPCESCKPIRIKSDAGLKQKKGIAVPKIKMYGPDEESEEKTILEPVITSIEEPFAFTGTAESGSKGPAAEPLPIPTNARELSEEPPAKMAKVTPKKTTSRKTGGT